MTIDATIAVLYAQTGFTGRAAHDASTGPQAALAMSRAIANEMSKLEKQQIQSIEHSDESRVADNNKQDGRNEGHFGSRRRKRQDHTGDDEPSNSNAPLVGNLLNIKV